MNQTQSWKFIIEALRRELIQGNSQISDFDTFAKTAMIEIIDKIRLTSPSKTTEKMVDKLFDDAKLQGKETRIQLEKFQDLVTSWGR